MIRARDVESMIAVILGFAALVTAHLAIALGLLARSPRWRAPIALIVLPLAPYIALRERMWLRGALWIAALVVYASGLAMASH